MKIKPQKIPAFALVFTSLAAAVFVTFAFYLFTYDENSYNFKSGAALISAGVLFVPRLVYLGTLWRRYISYPAVGIIEIAMVFLLAFNGFGALGWYREFQYYDMILHVITPFFIAFLLSVVVGSILSARQGLRIFWVQLFIIPISVAFLLIWEFWELSGDRIWHTQMLGQLTEKYDTWYDIGVGLVGILCACFVNFFKLKKIIQWLNA